MNSRMVCQLPLEAVSGLYRENVLLQRERKPTERRVMMSHASAWLSPKCRSRITFQPSYASQSMRGKGRKRCVTRTWTAKMHRMAGDMLTSIKKGRSMPASCA